MLSFAYSLLTHDCASALESVGLDAYVGFLHRDRPARTSLALDLMEEMRPILADRFVLTVINNRILDANDFHTEESGAVRMTDNAAWSLSPRRGWIEMLTATYKSVERRCPSPHGEG